MTPDELKYHFRNRQALPLHLRLDDGRQVEVRLRSEPWQLGHGAWVVLVTGRVGGWDINRLSKIEGAE